MPLLLLSMTGHGEAHGQQDALTVAVEVRTVNSRYFKLSVRGGEGYSGIDSQIENTVRQHVRRGTVQVSLRINRESTSDDYRLNETVLRGYRRQLETIYDQLNIQDSIHLESLLALPGVVDERAGSAADVSADWPAIERTLTEAMKNLQQMRADEGRAMAEDLTANCQSIATELDKIEQRTPLIVEGYRERLQERLNKWLGDFNVQVEQSDIVREVGLFAERSDISEETVRLRSHLEQFDSIMKLKESSGRKLDFLTQEMFRETNTIGSKANDPEIARHVIEVKAAIERMREMIQNVE